MADDARRQAAAELAAEKQRESERWEAVERTMDAIDAISAEVVAACKELKPKQKFIYGSLFRPRSGWAFTLYEDDFDHPSRMEVFFCSDGSWCLRGFDTGTAGRGLVEPNEKNRTHPGSFRSGRYYASVLPNLSLEHIRRQILRDLAR